MAHPLSGAASGHGTISHVTGGERIRLAGGITLAPRPAFDTDAGGVDDLLLTLSDGASITLIGVTRLSPQVIDSS
ncbi:hypothetical protein [Roseomonas rosulenta]|uniref:hypothetical protein n=1 Tax=Roseomonas rosulenta TaxID=2748667 RepID=UPI0018DF679F|nr:hypothetical protein [Roseomonas rosulenta]